MKKFKVDTVSIPTIMHSIKLLEDKPDSVLVPNGCSTGACDTCVYNMPYVADGVYPECISWSHTEEYVEHKLKWLINNRHLWEE